MSHSTAHDVTIFERQRWSLGLALALAVGLLQAAPEVLDGEHLSSITLRLLLWIVEAPLQFVALSLTLDQCARREFEAARSAVALLTVATAIGSVFGSGFVLVCQDILRLELDEKGPLSVGGAGAFGAISGVVKVAIWGATIASPYLGERALRSRMETEQLRAESEQLRVSSELATLRSRLEPHFLLNTLNAIAGLVTQNPREARRLLGCLGDLLRDSLQGHDEVQTLDREVTWLRRYAEILEARHGDAVCFEWEIASDAGAVMVPTLLLQPLVENAVQHGALCRAGGGRVVVRATVSELPGGAKLVCSVVDNGPGLSATPTRPGALGLHSVRRRLELRCPGAALALVSSGSGTSATIEIPIQPRILA